MQNHLQTTVELFSSPSVWSYETSLEATGVAWKRGGDAAGTGAMEVEATCECKSLMLSGLAQVSLDISLLLMMECFWTWVTDGLAGQNNKFMLCTWSFMYIQTLKVVTSQKLYLKETDMDLFQTLGTCASFLCQVLLQALSSTMFYHRHVRC